MTTHPTSHWSENLQQQTREAIEQIPATPDGRLHFKHASLGFAYATLTDLMDDRLVLREGQAGNIYPFAQVEALLDAGWALD
ncbi:MAG: hypothetical protein A3J24_08765 [Deltaproteobacteria bacterium RIFCSPLOWO2_02_FULL_53_8]|nr:MAG: hypothetical protein A3J24_08765 [Deltaproteobacteria bacterium RIFCSPLOWO2_02_FULL_53_8]